MVCELLYSLRSRSLSPPSGLWESVCVCVCVCVVGHIRVFEEGVSWWWRDVVGGAPSRRMGQWTASEEERSRLVTYQRRSNVLIIPRWKVVWCLDVQHTRMHTHVHYTHTHTCTLHTHKYTNKMPIAHSLFAMRTFAPLWILILCDIQTQATLAKAATINMRIPKAWLLVM